MSAKRALIVDDSKSARAFLARILERYEIAVDTAESAEQAIEYLKGNQPDVIFMDHLMPGMDGFQAVQSIKNNPRTAMIPIMMYTSQEGELYLGQARALGAVGVMPKQIRPADVSKVLYQLKLLPDRRGGDQTSFTPANATALAATAAPGTIDPASTTPLTQLAIGAEVRQMVDSVVREHIVELRRTISIGLDKQSERLLGDVKAAVAELPPAPLPPLPEAAPPPPRRAAWLVAALTSAAAAVLGYLWWQETQASRQLAEQLLAAQQDVVTARAAQQAAATAGMPAEPVEPAAAPAFTSEKAVPIPYGEVPLVGDRVEAVRTTLNDLVSRKAHGSVVLTSYPGRFCLLGNPTEGYALAPDDMLYAKCDLVGNPFDDALGPAQRDPVSVANLASSVRRESGNSLELQLVSGRADNLAQAYPAVTDKLTAGEWNRAASANNRLELKLRSAP